MPVKSFRIKSSAKKNLTREKPPAEDKVKIAMNLRKETDASAAVLGAAYVEDTLEDILRLSFVELGSDEEGRIFDGSQGGILGSFNAKIHMGFALGVWAM